MSEVLRCLVDLAAQRWNFDFRAGRPLTDDDGGIPRRYEWTLVDNESVPSFYSRVAEHNDPVRSDTAGQVSRATSRVTASDQSSPFVVNAADSTEMSTVPAAESDP